MNRKAEFAQLQSIMEEINRAEDALKVLRDFVDPEVKTHINRAIGSAQALRDSLWAVDKALETI